MDYKYRIKNERNTKTTKSRGPNGETIYSYDISDEAKKLKPFTTADVSNLKITSNDPTPKSPTDPNVSAGKEGRASAGSDSVSRFFEQADDEISRFTGRNLFGMGPEQWVKTMRGSRIPMSDTGYFSDSSKGVSAAVFIASLMSGVRTLRQGAVIVQEINPNLIRFSQRSVNDVEPIINSMRDSGWIGEPIDVVRMADGMLTTIDNTRVLAARYAGINVRATVHASTEALPTSMVQRFTTRTGVVPSTWGDAVLNRVGGQGSSFGTWHPFGSQITGWGGK